MLSLLASAILWVTPDIINPEVTLEVSCNRVELDINASPKATPVLVKFYLQDRKREYIWSYKVPMQYMSNGNIRLEPAEYWVEEIKNSHSLTLEVEGKQYTFNLTGSKEELDKCNGVVAE